MRGIQRVKPLLGLWILCREKIEQAEATGLKYVTITNEEIPLVEETSETLMISITNASFDMGVDDEEDLYVRI